MCPPDNPGELHHPYRSFPTLFFLRSRFVCQTVSHILLECALLQDKRSWMRNTLSEREVAIRLDELLTRPEARAIVAEFMIRTGLNSRPNCSRGRKRRRKRMTPQDSVTEGENGAREECSARSTVLP